MESMRRWTGPGIACQTCRNCRLAHAGQASEDQQHWAGVFKVSLDNLLVLQVVTSFTAAVQIARGGLTTGSELFVLTLCRERSFGWTWNETVDSWRFVQSGILVRFSGPRCKWPTGPVRYLQRGLIRVPEYGRNREGPTSPQLSACCWHLEIQTLQLRIQMGFLPTFREKETLRRKTAISAVLKYL